MRFALRCVIRTTLIASGVLLVILLVRAFDARRLPELQPWHRIKLSQEFSTSSIGGIDTFESYLKLESRLFDDVDFYLAAVNNSPEADWPNRYALPCTPLFTGPDQDWNQSVQLRPDRVVGGVLLLHGLTDSPYSMRAIAETLHDDGFYVLCLRLPGHGTVPSALASVRWESWVAAVQLAAEHVCRQVEPETPFHVIGYSNGATLAVDYALTAIDRPEARIPTSMVLLSPALGVSRFARLADWHQTLSWIPAFEKFKWFAVEPEIDPFKYASFPKNAGLQMSEFTHRVQGRLQRAEDRGLMKEFPPILTFQSTVDATADGEVVVNQLYDRLSSRGSELVLFDVNRAAATRAFLDLDQMDYVTELQGRSSLTYRLTMVTNATETSPRVVTRTREAGTSQWTVRPLEASWPAEIYSMSHIAIPFRPDDPLYGTTSPADSMGSTLNLTRLPFRGERNLLKLDPTSMVRLRYNPFFEYMMERIAERIHE